MRFFSITDLTLVDNQTKGTVSESCSWGQYYSTQDHTQISGYCFPYMAKGTQEYSFHQSNGMLTTFTGSPTAPTKPTNINDQVIQLADGTWRITRPDDSVEIYLANGLRQSQKLRNGQVVTFSYSDANTPIAVAPRPSLLIAETDAFGRSLQWRYDASAMMIQMIDPEGGVYDYVHATNGNLTSVTYPADAQGIRKTRTYLYELTTQTGALTGIVDENAFRYATYAYDSAGRATETKHLLAGGAEVEKYTLSYASSVQTDVTEPFGNIRNYVYTNILNYDKITSVIQSCAGCGGTSSSAMSYDANGNLASRTDFNGNRTNYIYDTSRNLQTARTEGLTSAGATTAQTRTTTTSWNTNLRLPRSIASPLTITTYAYHGDAGVSCAPAGASAALICLKSVQATTDAAGALGFSAVSDGASRTWAYTYNAIGQVLTMDGPRSDVTDVMSYTYDAQGNVATLTNAAGQVTSIPQYDASGRPLKMVDANGLETLLAYTPRGWLQSRSVGSTATGYLTTSHAYDGVGQLIQVTMPDASFLAYTYDAAHRLTQISDTLGNKISYSLDAMGNRIAEQSLDPQGALVKAHSRQVDALNRLYKDIGGTNPLTQITTNGYDNNGNLTTVTDALNRVTTQSYDALNRLTTVVDPFNGSANPTRYAYNGQDQLIQVTDPKGLVTTYIYNGQGEMLTQVSPDTGTTAFTYDAAGNLMTKLDARGVTSTYSYDALNRVTLIAYPDETVTYTYDACANGVGRLCSLTDKSGTTAYSYDLFGRVTAKSQTVGTLTQSIAYTYNSAGQLAQVTTPSGRSVTYGYQNNQPVSVTVNGYAVLDQAAYEPFGPIGGWRWGNSTPANPNFHVRLYDKDYRASQLTSDKVGTANLVKNYAWSDAGTLQSITDPASAGNSFAYGYDALDRLINAAPGGAAPVILGYSYDAVGNRISQTTGGSVTTYGYPSTSQRLQSLAGAQAKAYQYDSQGNLLSDGITTWSYGGNNRPVQAGNASVTSQFFINALGQRVKKSSASGATRFVYDEAGRLWGEYNDAGVLISETVWLNDQPVAVIK